MSMKELLTIVIPCKNESRNIYDCVYNISRQIGIDGITVIICDNSDDSDSINWLWKTKYDFMHTLQIKIIKGGFPAKARLEGSRLVKTPYVLFLDADIMLTDEKLLLQISKIKKGLVTATFVTDKPYNFVFRFFDIFQKIGIKLNSIFAVGGFQYWKTDLYWEVGGYDETDIVAEDYRISSKVNKTDFYIVKTKGIYTSARRFVNKGVFFMFKLMILCFLNKNNSEFFKKDHNYWK